MKEENNPQHIRVAVNTVNVEDLIQKLAEENGQLRKIIEIKDEIIDKLMNTVAALKEQVQQLRDEIAILKKQTPRPKIPPSDLEGPGSKKKQEEKSNPDGTGKPSKKGQPKGKSHKKKKTILEIHDKPIIHPSFIPEGAIFKGYKPYTVQDIVFRPHNTQYLIARWMLPNGKYISGELPKGIHGHYGPDLITFIIHQYHTCRVTEPLLLEQLLAKGVLISAGQLNNILIQNNDSFHREVGELLSAGIKADEQVQTDDTGGRHKGNNQYTNVVGNQWFSLFTTTENKSRINFFKILQGGKDEYLINEATIDYLKEMNVPGYFPGYISTYNGTKFTTLTDWELFLKEAKIGQKSEVRFLTEAALFASLIENGIPKTLGVHGDDARQFDAFIRSLCWIHEERHYRKLIMTSTQAKVDLERIREQIWTIYRNLKAYKMKPSDEAKTAIENQFDEIFQQHTSSPTLNERLKKTLDKKQKLLRVLERIETPLHNNASETDARAAKSKLKVSGGTRSDNGRDARDTFLSLKQTCRKLGVNFLSFLKDRVSKLFEIPKLAEIILQRSGAARAPS